MSDSNGEPIIGVTVMLNGNNTVGSLTDANGNYSITVPANSTLSFSCVGFATQEEQLNGRNVINVVLQEDTEFLDETVVIGYGTQKKRLLTGATINITGDEIQRQTREGVATTDTYHKYWEALQDAVKGFGDEVEPAVKLRLYRVAFESISSPTYMAGFARAGIGQQDAESFLTRVRDEAKKLEVEALSSEDTLLPIYQEIVDGYQDAQRNINTTYANPTLKASGASANEGGGE